MPEPQPDLNAPVTLGGGRLFWHGPVRLWDGDGTPLTEVHDIVVDVTEVIADALDGIEDDVSDAIHAAIGQAIIYAPEEVPRG